jgi:hypothetical protein
MCHGRCRPTWPLEEVAPTPGAVGAAKADDWHRQAREGRYQLALIAAGEKPRTEDCSRLSKTIDVPPDRLAAPHVPAEPSAKAARTPRRAAIQVMART